MKKLLLILSAVTMMYTAQATSFYSVAETSMATPAGWEKAKDGIWPGKDNVWYKIDASAKLWWSKDGKKWEAVVDGMWQDKDGKWLKIADKKLMWSADGGKTWEEVPEWKWQATDGKWYKFDKDWTLWVNN